MSNIHNYMFLLCANDSWRDRTNAESEEFVAQPNTIGEPKVHRSRCSAILKDWERIGTPREPIWVGPLDRDQSVGPDYNSSDAVEVDLFELQDFAVCTGQKKVA